MAGVRGRFAAEARWNTGFACFVMLLIAPGFWQGWANAVFSAVMFAVSIGWIICNRTYGLVELSEDGLVVHGYLSSMRVPVSELVAFRRWLVRRNGSRRAVLFVERADGAETRCGAVHASPQSSEFVAFIDRLNAVLAQLHAAADSTGS